jgi:hypothetical protein
VSGPKGYISFEEQLSSFERTTLIWALDRHRDKFTIYDAKGFKWNTNGFESPHPKKRWFLTPWMSVTYVWHEPKEYSLEELKAVYTKAVEMDDDNLTQFVESAELTKRISEAQSFEGLVEVFLWMRTDHSFNGDEEID